jgi:hypothetical protein
MPDFARTVDIHRKPGYDPAELFLDPTLAMPKARIAWALAKRKLGLRALLEVIPTDASLVKGSHGLAAGSTDEGPMFITDRKAILQSDQIAATDVASMLLKHLLLDGA